MADSVISLGKLADWLQVLRVECTICDRKERYLTDRLVAEYGQQLNVPGLLAELSSTCSRHQSKSRDRCCMYAPDLGGSSVEKSSA